MIMFIIILLSLPNRVFIGWVTLLKKERQQALFTPTHTGFLLVQKLGRILPKELIV